MWSEFKNYELAYSPMKTWCYSYKPPEKRMLDSLDREYMINLEKAVVRLSGQLENFVSPEAHTALLNERDKLKADLEEQQDRGNDLSRALTCCEKKIADLRKDGGKDNTYWMDRAQHLEDDLRRARETNSVLANHSNILCLLREAHPDLVGKFTTAHYHNEESRKSMWEPKKQKPPLPGSRTMMLHYPETRSFGNIAVKHNEMVDATKYQGEACSTVHIFPRQHVADTCLCKRYAIGEDRSVVQNVEMPTPQLKPCTQDEHYFSDNYNPAVCTCGDRQKAKPTLNIDQFTDKAAPGIVKNADAALAHWINAGMDAAKEAANENPLPESTQETWRDRPAML